MANNLGSLVVSLGLDAAEFTRGLSKSEYQAQQFARNVEKGIEFARNSFVAFAGAAVAAIAVVNRQAENVAAFQGLAEKIGDSAEAVASLKIASDVSGVALDSVAAASVKLTSALAKTDDEAKGVGAALGSIGLSVEEFKRLSPVEQIDAVAQAFAGYEDNAQKTAVAVQLFGRSGAELIPLFNDLADGAERQVKLTQEQILAADAYTKQTARLRSEIDSLVQSTAADAIPALSQMATMLQDVLRYATSASDGINLLGLAMSGAQVIAQTLIVVGSDLAFVFRGFAREFEAISNQIGAIFSGPVEGAWQRGQEIRQKYIDDAARARRELDAFQKSIMNPIRFGADDQSDAEARRLGLNRTKPGIDFDPNGPPKPKKDTDAGSFLDYQQQVTQRVGSLLEGSDVTQAKIYADTLKQLDDLYFSGALNADLYDSALKKLTGTTTSGKDALSKFAEEQKRLAELLGATESAGIEKQRADMELLTKALQDGVISEQQYLEAVSARLDLVADKTKEAKSFADELGLSFSSAFEDAVVGGGKFSDVLKGLGDDIVRLIVRSQVTKPLADAIGGLDFGGLFKGIFGGARASGGPVGGGKTYLVGERGPELFTPNNAGRITPNGALGGGAVTVRVVNESGNPVQASSASQSTMPDGSALIEIILAAAGDAVANRSGPLARGLESGYGLRPSMGG